MRRLITILFLFVVTFPTMSQNIDSSSGNSYAYTIIRTSTGMGGSSKTIVTPKGNYIVSQSIGQSSVIGTSRNTEFVLRQGYQQPSIKMNSSSGNFNDKLKAKIYPNPFDKSVYISFSERITNEFKIFLFDVKGSLIYTQKFAPSQFVNLELGDYSKGAYILLVEYNGISFRSKLIKN